MAACGQPRERPRRLLSHGRRLPTGLDRRRSAARDLLFEIDGNAIRPRGAQEAAFAHTAHLACDCFFSSGARAAASRPRGKLADAVQANGSTTQLELKCGAIRPVWISQNQKDSRRRGERCERRRPPASLDVASRRRRPRSGGREPWTAFGQGLWATAAHEKGADAGVRAVVHMPPPVTS